MVGRSGADASRVADATARIAQPPLARLRQREHRVVAAEINRAARHVVELVLRHAVIDLDRRKVRRLLVERAHDQARIRRRPIARLVAARAQMRGQRLQGLPRPARVDRQHEGLPVDGRGNLELARGIDRIVADQVDVGGHRVAGVNEDGVAVGPGAHRVFGGDVAAGAGLVLDQHGAAGERAQFLGKITHHHVGAAARRERADEVDVLGRIGLGAGGGGAEQGGEQDECREDGADGGARERQRLVRSRVCSASLRAALRTGTLPFSS